MKKNEENDFPVLKNHYIANIKLKKMKKLLLIPALVLGSLASNAQLALENFNSGTLPTGWVLINDGHTVNWFSTTINPILTANAWTPFEYTSGSGNYSMMTTSSFSPAATADRWLITPSFLVSSANTVFEWDDNDLGSGEMLQVLVSPTAGTTASSFTTTLSNAPAYSSGGATFGTHAVSLSAYNGMTIRMAFRDNTTNNWGLMVDNVKTAILPATNEMALTAVSPALNAVTGYGTVGSGVTIQGLVQNNGAATLTSFTAKYQVGTGPVVSEVKTVSVNPLATAVFSFTTPANIPALGSTPVKVWVELTGDAVHTNDTVMTNVYGVSRMPVKKMLMEEGTGIWCGFCVRGIVYMDSMAKMNGSSISQVAVHNSQSTYPDPMTNTIYDAFVSSKIGGYPNVLYDRVAVADPSAAFAYYNSYKNHFAFADMGVKTTLSGTTLNVSAFVKPALNLSGVNYKVAVAITEDGVTLPSGTYQHDYYSDAYLTAHGAPTGYYGSLVSSLYNFNSLPEYIGSPPLVYDAVARGIFPNATGAAGSLPTTLTDGVSYKYDFPAITLDPSWKTANMKAVVMLINGADGTVLNTENAKLGSAAGTAINEVSAGVTEFEIYPNPATEIVNTKFSLTDASSVTVDVLDIMGKVVRTVTNQNLTSGVHQIPVNVNNLSAGTYMVKITTDKGSVTERISVIK